MNAPSAEIALATEETLLILKIVFLALLYLFIVYIVRSATRDIGEVPQESIILGAKEAAAARAAHGIAEHEPAVARFVVLEGPGLSDDDFASAHHARLEARTDGIWVEDLKSTNGTFVNGGRISAERLEPGDVLRIGQTELVFEP